MLEFGPMDFQTRLANGVLGCILNSIFRANYSPGFMRRAFDLSSGVSTTKLKQKYPGVSFTAEDVDGIPTETVHPGGETQKKILFLHGGGYFMGSIHAYRRNALRIAYRCKAQVTLCEYRLAPEHPHPAALEDARKIYDHLLTRNGGRPFLVGGDSAGGGLTLALVLSLMKEGATLPSAVFCISPFADLTGTSAGYEINRDRDVWLTRKHVASWAPWYIGKNDVRDPLVSPYFGEYRGFPPLLMMVGDQEVLYTEAQGIADKARAAGGKVIFHPGRDMQHDWFLSLPGLPQSRAAMKALGQFVDQY